MALDQSDHEDFLKLLSRSERNIRRYIFTLVPNPVEVDDILQETLLALWRRFSEYRRDQPFDAWAYRFAHYQVLSHRKRRAVQAKHIVFSDQVVEALGADQLKHADSLNLQRDALAKCVEQLPVSDREILELRYATDVPISQVARDTNQPVKKLYQALERVRAQLINCVRVRLNEGTLQ